MKRWYYKAFDADYAKRYAHRDEQEAHAMLALFGRATGLKTPARLLDLGCGSGRHAWILAQSGFFVAGLDLSADLLALAQQKDKIDDQALKGDVKSDPVDYVRAEMRVLPFKNEIFDGALNLFTSFGYYRNDERNVAVIEEVARTLKKGGFFFFDFLNRPKVEAELQRRSERLLADGTHLEEIRYINNDTERVEKKTTMQQPDGRVLEHFESVRLFSREELTEHFANCQLKLIKSYGDYAGNPWSPEAPRLVMVAVKT